MDFQAEWIQSDFLESFLNDLQSSFLFRYEENAFAVVDRVGDNVGYGLALSGSRRAMHHETMVGNRIPDSAKLG